MPIKMIKGNLFDTKAEIIAHGVNCAGGFGSGIAGQIAKRWPKVRKAYLDKFKSTGWKLGDVLLVYSERKLKLPIIANMATQENFGYDGRLYIDYDAIETTLEKVLQYANAVSYSVAMPKVGCGLAGGDWSIVHNIIQTLSSKYDRVTIEIYEL